MENKTTDYAREYFKKLGIVYQEITREDINKLIEFLEIELKEHSHSPMRLSKIVHFKKNGNIFEHCYLYVNGSYFKKRQAISFEEESWIGFCGWACSNNAQPFIRAFLKWCNYISPTPHTLASPTFPTEKAINKDLEVSATPTPKEFQKEIPSLNSNIM
jgi:hypothetical protein